jgi:Ca2+-binding EF-hand superfamily protein
MRRLTLLLGTAVIALGLGSGALLAQTAGPKPGAKAPARGALFFEQMDADKDGRVTKAEFDAYRAAMFKAADKDGDGTISREEFAAYGDGRRNAFLDRMFARLDKNGDGKITADELPQRRNLLPAFERVDRNRDGFITLDEFTRLANARRGQRVKALFDSVDTNRDGRITAEEARAHGREWVMRADANGDGVVTLAELAAFTNRGQARFTAEEFKSLDANGDGKLSKEEYVKAALPRWFREADADKDGAVSKDEARAYFAKRLAERAAEGRAGRPGAPRANAAFDRLDADKDGKISAAEWKAAGDALFARLDKNKDGAITLEELAAGPRNPRGERPRGAPPAPGQPPR